MLTASITEENESGIEIPAMQLDKITVPTFVVTHEDNLCWVTPPEGTGTIKDRLINASTVKIRYFSGGSTAQSKPCRGLSAHGFFGIEKSVVDAIALFINQHS